jgi:hypothetical protein
MAVPAALLSLSLLALGVPPVYRDRAPVASATLLAMLLMLVWTLLRGYRERVLGPLRPGHLAGYVLGFLALDHALNLYCFAQIEAAVEFPGLALDPAWIIPGVAVITACILAFMMADWAMAALALRLMGSDQAASLAAKIVVYSLPASLLVALPGAESWRVGLAATTVVQAFTLWRLAAEGRLSSPRRPAPPPEIEFIK